MDINVFGRRITAPYLFVILAFLVVMLTQLARGADAQTVSPLYPTVPQPASTVPSSETVMGDVGSSMEYMRADARLPRVSRATTVVTASGGTFSGTWAEPLPAGTPTIVLTPIAAANSIDCQLTATPTSTGFQGRCWTATATVLNLGIITAGLNLNPVANTSAGVSVQVLAIPATQ